MKIGIIGNGFVGKATASLKCKDISILSYDINPELCDPPGCNMQDISECNLIFISVPTPMKKNGECHLGIVFQVVDKLKKICSFKKTHVIIRSTVPPGTTDSLDCYFMPEFLTEKKFLYDFKNNPMWYFGLKNTMQDNDFKQNIQNLFSLAKDNKCIISDKCVFLKNKEAEMVKLFRNTFLATKVSFCNEIYEFCKLKNINYDTVRTYACNDKRIGYSHSTVPGHDGKKGYGGTCFPKDINNLYNLMVNSDMKSFILKSVIERNETVDRKEKDWLSDKGRASI